MTVMPDWRLRLPAMRPRAYRHVRPGGGSCRIPWYTLGISHPCHGPSPKDLLLTNGSDALDSEPVEGIERAVFGEVSRGYVNDWLNRFVRSRLTQSVQDVFARTGRISAVYGLQLDDGSRVAAKIHNSPTSVQRLTEVVGCQRILSAADFPCPRPVDDPVTWDSRVITLESWQDPGDLADARQPAIRRAIARALAEQVRILRSVQADALAEDRPAWTRYEGGPWPVPHDSFFDFTVTPPGYEWLGPLAREAADVLNETNGPAAIAHGDWVCQNMRFHDSALVAAFDWDSLVRIAEPVIAGLSAGAYTEGDANDGGAPSPDEVAIFLADYDAQREVPFSASEQAAASAAATWVIAYNAQCGVSLLGHGLPQSAGSPLRVLEEHRQRYLSVRW